MRLITLHILYHNFWTRNLSKSIKESKDPDFSLVSNKNLSEILPSGGLGLGPDEVDQKGLKQLHLWHHSQKNQNQNNFFNCRREDLPNLLGDG